MSEFRENINAVRKLMPKGYIEELTNGSEQKRMALHRMFRCDAPSRMTPLELEMCESFIIYAKRLREKYNSMEEDVKELATL